MGVRGDFEKLKALRGALEGLRSGKVQRRVIRELGRTAHSLVLSGFAAGEDPYGKPWEALRTRKGQPLRDTGRLQNSISFRASGTGFSLLTSVVYAPFHQEGTKRIKKRPYFPDERGLPREWAEEFKEVADDVIDREVPR
jgi:phage gpG-like protein